DGSIFPENNGNVYVIGSLNGTIVFNGTTLNKHGNLVAKYDRAGNPLWAKAFGDSVGVYYLTIDNNGNVYGTGTYVSDSILVGNTTLTQTVSGKDNILLVK